MNKIKNYIPLTCELAGVEFKTVFVKKVQNAGNLGKSFISNGIIQLQEMNYGQEVSFQQNQNTYFHELTHMILDQIGELELSQNEKFVQNFGNLIFEFLRTAKWIRIEELKHNSYSNPESKSPFISEDTIESK